MSENKIQKIVFSGGPGVGKTSLLLELKKRGYCVKDEVFTTIFSQVQNKNKLEDLLKNKKKLIKSLIELQSKQEVEVQVSFQNIVFFDRGVIDIRIFAKEIEYKLNKSELAALESFQYEYVIIPAPLKRELYEQNFIRRQAYEESLVRQTQCIENYKKYFEKRKYDANKHIILVPSFEEEKSSSIKKRADYVLQRLQLNKI